MYANGKIYKLIDDMNKLLYIGSTCKTLNKREITHNANYNYGTNMLLYKELKKLKKNIRDNCKIELIEKCPCENKYDLLKKERYYIEKFKPIYNKNIPTRTNKEWEKDNRDKRRIYQREWERANKVKRNAYKRELRRKKKGLI